MPRRQLLRRSRHSRSETRLSFANTSMHRHNAAIRRLLTFAGLSVACEGILGTDFDDAHIAPPKLGPVSAGGTSSLAGRDTGGQAPLDSSSVGGRRFSVRETAGTGPEQSDAGSAGVAHQDSAGGVGSGSVAGGGGAAGSIDVGGTETQSGAGGDASRDGAGGKGGEAACGDASLWNAVTTSANASGALNPSRLARGIAFASGENSKCPGVIISGNLMLFMDCEVHVGDYAVPLASQTKPALEQSARITAVQSIGRARLAFFASDLWPDAWMSKVAWRARSPLPNERTLLIGVEADGGVRFSAGSNLVVPSEWGKCDACPQQSAALREYGFLFGADARLLGFCPIDACSHASECVLLNDLARQSGTLAWLLAMDDLFFGDDDGDGRSDVVLVSRSVSLSTPSSPTGFDVTNVWCEGCSGAARNAVGDVDGDHKADLVVAGAGLQLFAATGWSFQLAGEVPGDFSNVEALKIADVNGDGDGEVILIRDGELLVLDGLGSGEPSLRSWGEISWSWMSFDVADVSGDRAADAVFGMADGVAVMRSTGARFEPVHTWLKGVPAASPAWFFADVTGDRTADAIYLDTSGSSVYPSTGGAFVALAMSWRAVPLGERGNYFADVTGDGAADAIVHDSATISVLPSIGVDFQAAQVWHAYPFFGGL